MKKKRSLSLHLLQNDPIEALLLINPETREALSNSAFRNMFHIPDLRNLDDILPCIFVSEKDRESLEERIAGRFHHPASTPLKIKIHDEKYHLYLHHDPAEDLLLIHARSRAEFEQITNQLNEYAEGLVQNVFDLAVSEHTLLCSKNRLAKQLKASSEFGLTSNDPFKSISMVFHIFSENALAALEVSRCGIWQMKNNGKSLKSSDIFISSEQRHLTDVLLQEDDCPEFFKAIQTQRIILQPDVATDPLMNGLYENYFRPGGIASALMVSIILKGKVAGFVSFEHNTPKVWEEDEIGFGVIFADHVARILSDMERDALEEQLLQAQKMETIGTLAGGLAHDFNNVLGGIVSTLSILQFEVQNNRQINPEKLKKWLNIMDKAGQRAVEMVQQLLTLSRKQDTQFYPMDLKTTLWNVQNIIKNTFDKSINIHMQVPPEKAMAKADATHMEQALLNLCVNAGHAMTIMRSAQEPQGGTLTISLDQVRADADFCKIRPEAKQIDYWRISVEDTGVGMTPQTIAKIFVPFFTTKEKGKGTGLGLSMVYNIVQQHSGFINIYSEEGQGTTFDVYIPVLHNGEIRETQEKCFELPQGKGIILVVDDEEIMRQAAGAILKKCGYEVLTASDGLQALQIFGKRYREIACVLLDLVMPQKSGEQVYLEMKKIDSRVKVIMTSGFKQDERVTFALAQGVNAFIQKPYTLEKLSEVIKEVFDRS
jgi:signal transduction histidine kinase/CheY-like chemotaxis protein